MARVLFSSSPGAGHVQPLLPLALALRARGHDVLFATASDGCGWAEAAGIDTVVVGIDSRSRMAEYERRWPAFAALRGEARVEKMFPRLFGAITAHAAFPGLCETAESWQPQVVVSEAGDFAGPVVAAALGVPQVTHGFGLVVPRERVELAAEFAAPLWQEVGLEVPRFGGLYDHLYIDVYPPSMQPDDLSYIPRIVRRRPSGVTEGGFPVEESVARTLGSGTPLVYVTFGTLFNRNPVFAGVVDAARTLAGYEFLVTVGPDGDPEQFGPLPAHVTVTRYVSQNAVFPRTAAVVSHAGSGTLLGALAAAIPQVCIPQAADQFRNAAACEAAGAGVTLASDGRSPVEIADAIRLVLDDQRYRRAASEVSREIAEMPPVEDVAAEIENLVS